jgi:hypothetical protein
VNDQRLQDLMAKLPIAKATGKTHKFPWAMRFLAASNATGLTPVAKWCTCLLQAIVPALVAQWKGLFRSLPQHALQAAGIVGDDPMPWFISNTEQLVRMVAAFSHVGMSQEAFEAGHGFAAFDVEQLYVMIVLDYLVSSLHTCLHTAWRWFTDTQPDELPPQPPAGNNEDPMDVDLNGWLVVYANKGVPAEFIPGGEAAVHAKFGDHTPERRQGMGMWNHHLGKDKFKSNFCVLPLESACWLVDLIVWTSFVRFGGVAYHQTTGIPMGVNPGVFLANFYLYDHEMKWLSQVRDLLQRFPPALQRHMGKFPSQ